PRPFLIRRRRQVREVGRSNPAIGLARRPTFREKTVRLRKGDRLFFYTDGLTDAGAPARLLSSDDLRGALSGREALPLGSLIDNVIGWACPTTSRDDIAVLAAECR
ncbi:MAG: PP2C family protein-serine/threonine phosphatase, partial [Candidatus Rokuibacteriota bacterium]